MTEVPLYITELIDVLEAELRNNETTAGRLRDTISHLRGTWNVSPMAAPTATRQAPSPPVQSAEPERRPMKAAAPTERPRVNYPPQRAPAGDQPAQMARVLKIAATIPQPFRMAQLHMKVSDINRETLKDYVAQFVAVGAIAKAGERAGTRYTVSPKVDASKLDGLAGKDAPAAAVANNGELAQSVMRVLATGSSYDLRELIKGLREVAPGLTEAQLQPVVLELVEKRQVLRIQTETGPRFRKRAA